MLRIWIFKFRKNRVKNEKKKRECNKQTERLSISKQLQFISFISNYFWQSSVKSNKQAEDQTLDRQLPGCCRFRQQIPPHFPPHPPIQHVDWQKGKSLQAI